LPELETTLDAPRGPAAGRTPLPSRHVARSSTGLAGHATPAPGEPPLPDRTGTDPSGPRSPSSASSAPGGTSQLLAMVSAAALVVIAIAVIAFVVREPGDRPPPRVDAAPRGASDRPVSPPAPASGASATTGPPPAAAPEAAVSVTDEVAQQTESARALYRAGKYDEAASAAGRVLKRSPGNAEAQRLMADVTRYARQAATEAVSGLTAARTRAESAGAPAAAPAAFARAVERERSARARLAARDYAKAATAAYAAQGLFDAAAAESLGRTQARAAAEPPATRPAPPPAAEEPRVPIQFPAVASVPPPAAVSVPGPAPGPTPGAAPRSSPGAAPALPAATTPPRAPAAPERRAADPQEAIRRVLQQYSAALEARNLPALKQVWPGLGGAQERAIKAEFDNARQISVTLDSPRIQVSGATATVVATRHYSLATVDGHELRSDARSTFQLRAADGGWVIESIRFEAAR
jgi:hypothetical protein